MQRRTFIKKGASTICSLFVFSSEGFRHFYFPSASASFLNEHQDKSLIKVLDILFPKEVDSPSASELGSIDFFRWLLEDPETKGRTREKIKNGLVRLDQFSDKKFGKNFIELSATEDNNLFIEFLAVEKNEDWASLLLKYLFEAIFGDPVYGGNLNEGGWKWIEHRPGFPRPPKRNWNIK